MDEQTGLQMDTARGTTLLPATCKHPSASTPSPFRLFAVSAGVRSGAPKMSLDVSQGATTASWTARAIGGVLLCYPKTRGSMTQGSSTINIPPNHIPAVTKGCRTWRIGVLINPFTSIHLGTKNHPFVTAGIIIYSLSRTFLSEAWRFQTDPEENWPSTSMIVPGNASKDSKRIRLAFCGAPTRTLNAHPRAERAERSNVAGGIPGACGGQGALHLGGGSGSSGPSMVFPTDLAGPDDQQVSDGWVGKGPSRFQLVTCEVGC